MLFKDFLFAFRIRIFNIHRRKKKDWADGYRNSCLWKFFYRVIVLIKEIVEDIRKKEDEAQKIRASARENAVEILRQAREKAEEIRNSLHSERKGIINSRIEEFEKSARKSAEKIIRDTESTAERIEEDALENIDSAINVVFERVINYGNKAS